MVKAELVEWLNRNTGEAAVRITDGEFVITAFCEKFSGCREYSELELTVLNGSDAMIADGFVPPVKNDGFAGQMTACIVDKNRRMLRVGNILLDFDGYIPGDAEIGQWLMFSFSRLDYVE